MKQTSTNYFFLGLTALPLILGACGKKNSGHRNDEIKDDAGSTMLDNLSPEQRDKFEKWKNSLVKSCSFSSAFPFLEDEIAGKNVGFSDKQELLVDSKILGEKLALSPVIVGSEGEIAILGNPSSPLGQSTSNRSMEQTIDGQSTKLEVSAVRNGADCVVTYNGQQVYKSNLYSSYPVDLYFDPTTAADLKKPSRLSMTAFDFAASASTARGRAVNLGSITQRIIQGMGNFDRVHSFLSSKLSIEIEQIRSHFRGGPVPSPASIRMQERKSSPFLAEINSVGSTFGEQSDLSDLTSTQPSELKFEILFQLPHIFESPTGNQLHRFSATWAMSEITVAVEGVKSRIDYAGSLTNFSFVDRIETEDEMARSCFLQRVNFMTAFSREILHLKQPLFDDAYRPCYLLSPSFSSMIATDQKIQQTIVSRAVGNGFQLNHNYANWDHAYLLLAQSLLSSGQDLKNLLTFEADLATKNTIEQTIDRFSTIRNTIKSSKTADELYSPKVLSMMLRWMFESSPPSDNLIDQIGLSLVNAGTDFSQSLLKMIDDLESNHSSESMGAKAAACGASLQGDHKNSVLNLLIKTGNLIGLKDWSTEARSTVLQNCWSQEILSRLSSTSESLTSLQQEEKGSVNNGLYALDAEKLAKQAMDEYWTPASFEGLRNLTQYIAVTDKFNFCAREPTSTQIFICATKTGLDSGHARIGGMFAPVYNNRYSKFAKEMAVVQKEWLKDSNYFNLRYSIEDAFLHQSDALWSRCNNEIFDRNKTKFFEMINRRRQMTDIIKSYRLEQEIKDHLQDCP